MTTRPTPREDIQTAITILGRRPEQHRLIEWQDKYRLDFSFTDLSGINFSRGNFPAAIFHKCKLEASMLRDCDLEGAQFHRAILNHSDFFGAKLKGTIFDFAVINRPEIPAGGMSESITMADIHSISVAGADLSGITYLGEQHERVFGTKDTTLSRELKFDHEKQKTLLRELRKAERENDHELVRETLKEMKALRMFPNWCPYDASDMARGSAYTRFREKMGLIDWPHTK